MIGNSLEGLSQRAKKNVDSELKASFKLRVKDKKLWVITETQDFHQITMSILYIISFDWRTLTWPALT